HLGQIAQLLDKTPKILGFHRVLSLVRITRRVSPYIKSKQSHRVAYAGNTMCFFKRQLFPAIASINRPGDVDVIGAIEKHGAWPCCFVGAIPRVPAFPRTAPAGGHARDGADGMIRAVSLVGLERACDGPRLPDCNVIKRERQRPLKTFSTPRYYWAREAVKKSV
ncbi:MAG: hypothetical protein KJ587_06820, partial [Alphaproteobacteria bacterium]|nr:hypothetical protein [Alphaproteobacteria bacterium]